MSDFLAALGLVLVIEGVLYALAPQTMRRLILSMAQTPADMLRIGGLVSLGIGVGVVWLVRG